jgi:bacterioferritin-associated ferredoxin
MGHGIEIDRCICFEKKFVELKISAERDHLDAEEIQSRYGCGSCCGLCRPYIERMLVTGETVFHEILPSTGRA